jgi:Trypsin-like peptidase domain
LVIRRRPAPAAPAVLALALLSFAAVAVRAQSVDGIQMPPAPESRSSAPGQEPRLQLAAALARGPLHSLPPAAAGAADQLAALRAWNAAGKLPLKNGFRRTLESPAVVRLGGLAAASLPAAGAPKAFAGGWLAAAGPGEIVWGTRVTVTGAWRLRLHLTDVHLPAGTRMWVAPAADRAPRGFGLELLAPAGDLWTPSVGGDSLLFEVHVGAAAGGGLAAGVNAAAGFTVPDAMELFDVSGRSAGITLSGPAASAGAAAAFTATSAATAGHFTGGGPTLGGTGVAGGLIAAPAAEPACIVDSSCPTATGALANLANYRHAVAQLNFTTADGSFACSGGLLNDRNSDLIPYLLTANHCFSDQEGASSLEAFFDYYTSSCNGAFPDENGEPRSNGSTLLATAAAPDLSDYTLVRLSSVPPGRYFLGWDASPTVLTQGTQFYRLSYPAFGFVGSDPERFSQSFFQTGNDIPICNDVQAPPSERAPRPQFIYATVTRGGTFGGSSGAPLLIGNGRVVGQLLGGCPLPGHDGSDGCDYTSSEIDGAFSTTYFALAPWLDPQAGSGPCTPDATTLCIDRNPGDRRFKIKVNYATVQGGGSSGAGQAVPLSSLGITEGGLCYFCGATNPEMLIKVIDGCALTQSFWVFYAATTNVGFVVTVYDTVTGHLQAFSNTDLQAAPPVQSTSGLPCT